MKKLLKNIEVYLQKEYLIISTTLVFILFHTLFEELISKLFVDTIFSQLSSAITNDIIFFILFLYVLYNFFSKLKRNFYISQKSVTISSIVLLLIIYYCFFDSTWSFTPLFLIPFLCYIELIIVYLVLNILLFICHKDVKIEVDSDNGFLFDNPNIDTDMAIESRKIIAENIAHKIKNTVDSKSSFAIGITAEWGRGKTSFLELIENKIVDDKKRIIVHFNPWINNDENSLIKSFFEELSKSFNQYNRELSENLIKYAELLSAIDKNSSKIKNGVEGLFGGSKDDLKKRYENINRSIISSGLQLIIVVDDLDRLYEKELVEVLKLIRNTASFANTVFIVAYDRNYIISSLKKTNDYRPNSYLEKIFQVEIALPPFEKDFILGKIRELFMPRLSENDKIAIEKYISGKLNLFDYSGLNIDLIDNLRDVVRLANSFFISYESLKGEIVLKDLFNIELLRIKYLSLYNLLSVSYNDFLTNYSGQTENYQQINYLALQKSKDDEGNEKDTVKLKDYLNEKYSEIGLQKFQVDDAMKYVFNIFPYYSAYSKINIEVISIANPSSIDRYFHYKLMGSDLSEIEFSKYRQGDLSEFSDKIIEWIGIGFKNEIANRFLRIKYFQNKDDYEKIIQAIFNYASQLSSDKVRPIGYDFDDLYEKIKFRKVANLYNEDEDVFKLFLKGLFESQEYSKLFLSNLIDHIIERNPAINSESWNFIISKDELNNYKLMYFELYTKETTKIDLKFFLLFHACKYTEYISNGDNSYRRNVIQMIDSKQFFIKCAGRLIDDFIRNIITKYFQVPREMKEMYLISKTVLKVWDSWDKFEDFISTHKDKDVKGLDEFIEFFEKCKDENFNRYIEFQFSDINLEGALLFNE